MRHVEIALEKYMKESDSPANEYVQLVNTEDVKGIAPIVSFIVQSDPIGEVGINGCQALDMLKYTKCLFQSLNEVFPCRENTITITKLEEAIHWQDARTKDRMRRNVEGANKS
jgi:hypothetical protein